MTDYCEQIPSSHDQGVIQARPIPCAHHLLDGRHQRPSYWRARHNYVLSLQGRSRCKFTHAPLQVLLINYLPKHQHLGRNLAVELGQHNITSNVIAPGFFPSKLAQGLISNLGGEDSIAKDNPLGRLGEPEDIAGVATFLCSPAGRYVNGVVVSVDGGARLAAGRQSRL